MELGGLYIFKMIEEYSNKLKEAMDWLGKQKDTFFLGQAVVYPGSPTNAGLKDIPKEKKLELPLMEDDQMGMSIGLALEGFIPISIYPRIDFLILAMNQLVNHLDKIEAMSKGEFKPGIIIRTQIGNTKPIWPGLQHCGDYRKGISYMLKGKTYLRTIENANEAVDIYKQAYKNAKKGQSSIIVELPQGGSEKLFHKVKIKGTKMKGGKK